MKNIFYVLKNTTNMCVVNYSVVKIDTYSEKEKKIENI